mmetsp:Transcript_16984/g.37114  ORF Transcript_16984/g.37114 Transcript_16984/m.37114 type:complete len:633 (+) Transcript_16984:242-2140(+)
MSMNAMEQSRSVSKTKSSCRFLRKSLMLLLVVLVVAVWSTMSTSTNRSSIYTTGTCFHRLLQILPVVESFDVSPSSPSRTRIRTQSGGTNNPIVPYALQAASNKAATATRTIRDTTTTTTTPSLSLSLSSHRKRKPQPTTTALGSTSNTGTIASLVASDDSWGNLAALAGVTVVAQHLGNPNSDTNSTLARVARLLGAPVTAMAITFLLASTNVLAPGGTQTSRNLQALAIRFATPWILLGADFRLGGAGSNSKSSNRTDGGSSSSDASVAPLVVGFGLASLATLAGGWVGYKAAGGGLVGSALGNHNGPAIAAALLAKNIGGGINYVAVCAALRASPEAVAAGLCIDNIGALVYFPISNLLAGRYPDIVVDDDNDVANDILDVDNHNDNDNDAVELPPPLPQLLTVSSISTAIFAAATLLWMGDFVATKLVKSPSSQIPIVTLLSVLWAGVVAPRLSSLFGTRARASNKGQHEQQQQRQRLQLSSFRSTCDTLGTVCLYLFFTTAGAPGIKVARSMASALGPLSVFSVLLYAVHGGILSALYQLGHDGSWFRRTRTRTRTRTRAAVIFNSKNTGPDSWPPPSFSECSWEDWWSVRWEIGSAANPCSCWDCCATRWRGSPRPWPRMFTPWRF